MNNKTRAPLVHISRRAALPWYKAWAIRAAATELIPMGKDTVAIQDDRIERTIMEKFGLSPSELQVAIEDAIDLGEARTDKLLDSGENRVSDIQEVAVALKSWCGADSKRFVRTIHADREGEFLRAYCIDPKEISMFLNSTSGTVHMSGTLHPMDQYARVIGLSSNCTFRRYPSPFPPENRLVVYTPHLTTRWQDLKANPDMKARLERTIADLCNSVDKNTLVFCIDCGGRYMESVRGEKPHCPETFPCHRELYQNLDQTVTCTLTLCVIHL